MPRSLRAELHLRQRVGDVGVAELVETNRLGIVRIDRDERHALAAIVLVELFDPALRRAATPGNGCSRTRSPAACCRRIRSPCGSCRRRPAGSNSGSGDPIGSTGMLEIRPGCRGRCPARRLTLSFDARRGNGRATRRERQRLAHGQTPRTDILRIRAQARDDSSHGRSSLIDQGGGPVGLLAGILRIVREIGQNRAAQLRDVQLAELLIEHVAVRREQQRERHRRRHLRVERRLQSVHVGRREQAGSRCDALCVCRNSSTAARSSGSFTDTVTNSRLRALYIR